jgi:hypothetical protein
MTGAPDPRYVAARRTLLDALEGLGVQRQSVTLVGAQAVYVHTGEDESLAIAPYTTDADISLDPDLLAPEPLLEEAMSASGFTRSIDPAKVGTWVGRNGVEIDLMVPEARAGVGRRGADITPHARGTARRARGLEGALVDRDRRTIGALDPSDTRSFEIWIAGPGALLVAKLLKIADRIGRPSRLDNKDALDLFRLLQVVATKDLATALKQLRENAVSREVTGDALAQLDALFGAPDAQGVQMVVAATIGVRDPAEIAASCAALANDLLAELA